MEMETPLSPVATPNPKPTARHSKKKKKNATLEVAPRVASLLPEEEDSAGWRRGWVMLEGYMEVSEGGDRGSDSGGEGVGRTKSLTDEDLEELKGCLDLGFGFSYDEIPELCGTLPALELCYSLTQKFQDDHHQQHLGGEACATPISLPAPLIANWKISSPGDNPEDVKARLKYWAQAVACTVRLCS